MKIRRFCSGLLAAVLLLGLMVLPAGAAAASTVSTEEAIQVINALGIMVGDESGEFHLNRRVTRAEFITMAVNATGTGDQVGVGIHLALPRRAPDPLGRRLCPGGGAGRADLRLSGWDLPPLQPDHPGGGRYHRPQAAGLHRRGLLWGLSHRPAGHVPQPKLDRGVTAQKSTDVLTRQDTLYLFYNLLSTNTKEGTPLYLTSWATHSTPPVRWTGWPWSTA